MGSCKLIKDFTPEMGRIYSVSVIVYGLSNKKKLDKKIELAVYVENNKELFINRICTRCENNKPKIKHIYKIEIFYLRKAGYILNHVKH